MLSQNGPRVITTCLNDQSIAAKSFFRSFYASTKIGNLRHDPEYVRPCHLRRPLSELPAKLKKSVRWYGHIRRKEEGSSAETFEVQTIASPEPIDYSASGTPDPRGQQFRELASKAVSQATDATSDEDLLGDSRSPSGTNEEIGERLLQDAKSYIGKVSVRDISEQNTVGRVGSDPIEEALPKRVQNPLEAHRETDYSSQNTAKVVDQISPIARDGAAVVATGPKTIKKPLLEASYLHTNANDDVVPEGSWMSHTNRSTSTLNDHRVGPFIHPKDIAHHPENKNVPNVLRGLMRTLAHPVVIITAADPSQNDSDAYRDGQPPLISNPDGDARPQYQQDHFHGATISSLTTLSLTGADLPILTFNLQRPSSTLQGVLRQRHFLIHLCRSNRRGAEIADTFARFRGNPFMTPNELKFSVKHVVQELPDGHKVVMPQLVKNHAFHGILRCELIGNDPEQGWAQVADHTIIFAKVNEIFTPRELYKDIQNLSYSDGAYNISRSGLGLPTQTLAQPMDLPRVPREHISAYSKEHLDGDVREAPPAPLPSSLTRKARNGVVNYVENIFDRTGRKT